MKKHRRHYTPEEKVAILRRHLLEKEPISKLCDEVGTPADRNCNNPNLHKGWIRKHYPIDPQVVKMEVGGRKIANVRLLRAETDVRFRQNGGVVEFTIPKVVEYEVAALTSA